MFGIKMSGIVGKMKNVYFVVLLEKAILVLQSEEPS